MPIKKAIITIISITLLINAVFLFNNDQIFSQSKDYIKFEKAKELFKKGFHLFNERKYVGAVEFFRKAIAKYPQYYTAREYLARSYKLAGFVDEALMEWELLSKAVANNVSIVNKINTIKYRETKDIFASDSFDYLLSDKYNSIDLRRFKVRYPIDIAIDLEKNIYVTSFSSGKLVKLDLNGKGKDIFSLGTDSRFYGVDYWDERLCVADFKLDTIHILNMEFDVIRSFGSSGRGKGEFHGPEGVAYDKKGNIYIVDSGNFRVQKFDKDGNYILEFGEKGKYKGQFNNPSHIVENNEKIYITDTGNKQIACFDDSGNFINNIKVKGLEKPRGIDIYNDNLVVSDEKKGLLFYGLKTSKAAWFNSWNNKDKFRKLVSSEINRDGILYCLDYKQDSVLVFTPIRSRYNNLDIEVISIDTLDYPVVSLFLNIRNRHGKPVYGLDYSNFKITEDSANIKQFNINYFKEIENSVSIVLCVDRSNKTSGYHNDIPWVSDFILKKMKKNDSVKVLNFNKDSWVGNDFDWSRRRTIRALRKRIYDSEKCFGKTLYNAVTDLLNRYNRRGVVLVSDGSIDSNSFKQYSQRNIIEYAKSHFIPIYFIVFKHKNPILQRIAEDTGGAIYKANELDGLRKIYRKIKYSEENRYLLTYSTYEMPNANGWWADVKIEVFLKGQSGIEWCGFFVP